MSTFWLSIVHSQGPFYSVNTFVTCVYWRILLCTVYYKQNDPLRAFRGTATAYMTENYQTYFGPAVVVRKGGAVTESWPRAHSAILGSREARTEYWLWLLTCWLLAFGC